MARVKEDTLLVRWDKREQDFKVWFPRSCDGGFVIDHLVGRGCCVGFPGYADTFIHELEKRGYDPTTLRFSIERRKDTTR